MTLTKRQLEILRFAWDYKQAKRMAPTLQEIADQFGIAKVTALGHLRELEEKCVIDRERYAQRGLTVTKAGRETLGLKGGTMPATALRHAWDLATHEERHAFYKDRVKTWSKRSKT